MGVNAIAAYGGSWRAPCLIEGSGLMRPLYQHVFKGTLTPIVGPWNASLAFALAFTALFWAAAAYADRRGWRFTI